MANVSAELVKELRNATNVGMMECKRALVEADGDNARAVKILRERGLAIAERKASRSVNQGMIASVILDEGRVGSLIEVDCETDFVAKNEEFKMFVKNLAEKAALTEVNFAESVRDEVIAKIAQIGENIVVRRTVRYVLQDNGLIASYIHNGNTIGVLVEIGCQKSESTATPVFKELAKDICLHIAASNPQCIDREHVSAELIASERDIYAKQASDKPAHIVDKIVDGKMNKFFEHICLINQAFVKDQDKTIIALLKEKDSELNESLHIRRFARFQVGETS